MLDDILLNLLKKTRLSDKQAAVYLATLQLGKATVSEIATAAHLKRSITYVILDTLIAIGYIQEVPGQRKKIYTAIDPNAIASELDGTAKEFREMLPYLRSLQRKAGKPHVTYYTGIEGARQAFSQIRRPKEARYAVSTSKALKRVPGEVERWKKGYLAGTARPGGRHLLTNTIEDHDYAAALTQGGQLVRFLKKGQELDIDLALVDNTVYLTAFEDQIHVTVIESEALYRSLCALYDLSWQASKPL